MGGGCAPIDRARDGRGVVAVLQGSGLGQGRELGRRVHSVVHQVRRWMIGVQRSRAFKDSLGQGALGKILARLARPRGGRIHGPAEAVAHHVELSHLYRRRRRLQPSICNRRW